MRPLTHTLRLVAALLALAAVLPTVASAADARGVSPRAANPLVGERWYVDPREPSYRQWESYTRQGRSADAAEMAKVAFTPKFRWFGRFTRPVKQILGRQIAAAEAQGTVPLLTTLRHQGKKCHGGYTGGGASEDARTRAWYREFAEGVGNHHVVIAFEPDSLGTIKCLTKKRQRSRLDVLRYGVSVLSKLPNATVYLEATASDWEPAGRVAKKLRYIGVSKVRGFMVNVTHYDWTNNNIRYGHKISRLVGGKHFVVSTAMNGRGPVRYKRRVGGRGRIINVHCHPLFRGLGIPPTTNTGDGKVDAFLWINRPGYSGGRCNGGPGRVGAWWPERALMLARNATTLRGEPRGWKYGFPGGQVSLHSAAGDQLER